MIHESLPKLSFTHQDIVFLQTLEQEMRPIARVQELDQTLRKTDKALYNFIDTLAYAHSQNDPELRGFYFSEFLLLTHAVQRINTQIYFPLTWAEEPPLLPL